MLLEMYVDFEDIERYNIGEDIIATDKSGKSIVLKTRNHIKILVKSTELIERQDYISTGFSKGTFNKFIIRRGS